jgi:AraC-like DNA-binding protein
MSILDLMATTGELPPFVSRQVRDARYWFLDLRPKPSPGVVPVCGGCERVAAGYEVRRPGFPFFVVELVEEGQGSLELNGHSFPLHAGVGFAYGPGVPHVIRTDDRRLLRKYFVCFAGAGGEGLLRSSPVGTWQAVQMDEPHELTELYDLLQREGSRDTPRRPAICAALLEALLHKLEDRAVHAGARADGALTTYRRVKRYLQEHYLELRTVEDAAQATHVTPAYLARLFRRFDGGSPYQCLLRLKMDHAAALLLRSDRTVAVIAEEMGFADAFHFSRVFKRVFGVSPRRFVRQ